MSTLVGLIQFCIGAATLLGVTFMVTLALPDSPMKDFAIKIMGWAMALVAGLYVVSPVDLMPEAFLGPLGAFDDIFALMLGIGGAIAAQRSGKPANEVSKPVVDAITARQERAPRSRIPHKP